MPLELIRVDERLLHGQVVVGWGEHLGLEWYVVADDELAGAAWEQEIYREGLPEGAEAEFLTVEAAAGRIDELDARPTPGALLTRSTAAARRLAEVGALEGRRVNLGCLPAREGRREVRPYLHLAPAESEDVRALARAGAEVGARDVPTARALDAEEILEAVHG